MDSTSSTPALQKPKLLKTMVAQSTQRAVTFDVALLPNSTFTILAILSTPLVLANATGFVPWVTTMS